MMSNSRTQLVSVHLKVAVQVLENAAKFVSPHILKIADTSVKIVQMRDRVSINKELSHRVIYRVATFSMTLVEETKRGDIRVECCEQDLQRYEGLLEDVYRSIRSSAGITGFLKKGEIKETLEKCLARLGEFDSIFELARLRANVSATPDDDKSSFMKQAISATAYATVASPPTTLKDTENLPYVKMILTYMNQGRWKEAETLQVAVLEVQKGILGEEHPDTLTSMNNLASTYQNQSRWKEAEALKVAVLETRRKVLGDEHPDTLTSMNNLAVTYHCQGRWKEAEELGQVVFEKRRKVLGEEHPHTLQSMANLVMYKGR